MSEQKPQTGHNIPVWGVFLLFLGIVFLLQTLDVLPWGLWGNLWRFWPVLIIAVGLGILLRRYNTWLVSGLVLALLFACLGIAIWQYGLFLPSEGTTKSYSQPLDSLTQTQVEIDFTAGRLSVSSLPTNSPYLVEVDSKGRDKHGDIRADFQRQDNEGRLYLSTKRVDGQFWDEVETNWEVRLSRNIPLTIYVKSAASDLDLNLSQLEVTELRMDVDAGNYEVKMPSSAITYAYIEANVANIEITIPDGVAVKLKTDVDLTIFEVDESRFPRKGDYYMSGDFDHAENWVELELDCNLGRVRVR